ncbi:MAG: UDP-N-acetylmuramoyl-L-alanine--D-glutamate ligase [Coprococcus sp.]
MIHTIKELIRDKRVLILGYGREGRSSWQRIRQAGGYSRVAVADVNPVRLEEGHPAELICGPDYQSCLDDFDIVFKSPGIVLERDIHTYRCEIISETELFFRRYGSQCIGITGTKGKSTTTTLIYHILKETGHDCVLAGNIGIPMFDLIDEIGDDTLIVCELSCHQLEYVSCGPHVGLLLNIHEEHLDHYGTMEKYVAAKENIYRPQKAGDILVCNVDNLPADGTYCGQIISVCDEDGRAGVEMTADIELRASEILAFGHRYAIPAGDIRLIGHHNYVDIAFAYAICRMYDVSDEAFTEALISYEPLPHRLQYIGDACGIHFYDDSISTICETTIQALKSLPDTDAVLIGGMDRGIDYRELISFLSVSSVPYILLMEETGRRIFEEIQKYYPDFGHPERLILVYHLDGAVALAKKLCRPGRCCIMSPAAASYGIFKNFEARGEAFKELVLED